jgi:hypothetical protein
MKGVIFSINPQACIVDLTHNVPPRDVADAAFTLLAAYKSFPAGTIHVAVVDPGAADQTTEGGVRIGLQLGEQRLAAERRQSAVRNIRHDDVLTRGHANLAGAVGVGDSRELDQLVGRDANGIALLYGIALL